jgi:hypothetical protein
MIDNILQQALINTISKLTTWVMIYVPERTGRLKESLLYNLNKNSFVDSTHNLVLQIGTGVHYAKYVNRFSDVNVKHYNEIGYAYYNGYNGRILLNDPSAVGGYAGLMRMEARKILKQELSKAIKQISYNTKLFTQQLKVTNT